MNPPDISSFCANDWWNLLHRYLLKRLKGAPSYSISPCHVSQEPYDARFKGEEGASSLNVFCPTKKHEITNVMYTKIKVSYMGHSHLPCKFLGRYSPTTTISEISSSTTALINPTGGAVLLPQVDSWMKRRYGPRRRNTCLPLEGGNRRMSNSLVLTHHLPIKVVFSVPWIGILLCVQVWNRISIQSHPTFQHHGNMKFVQRPPGSWL